jgi:TonB family protein
MKRVFGLIIVCAFTSASAHDAVALAQARRVRRPEPPKEERAGKSETKDDAKGEATDGAQANDDGKPLTGKEVGVRAVIKRKPEPLYPREARRYQVRGRVKLRIILGSDGRVRDEIDVLEGLPYGVTEECIRAARRIEFEPARKDGRPVSQYVTVEYNFTLY